MRPSRSRARSMRASPSPATPSTSTLPAATHKWPILLDEIQQRHREGPCLTAAWEEKTIHVADLETDDRFPLYRRDALEQTPIRSIMAFQLFIAGETMGALNVYAEEPRRVRARYEGRSG